MEEENNGGRAGGGDFFSLSAVPESLGAEPSVSVDETMYVTLDYLRGQDGRERGEGVLHPTGVGTYTDYGDYEKIVNMTDSREPEAGDGSVTWNFDGENKRFYYEGVMDPEQVELPWNFDVSYKLNGVEMRGRGAGGGVRPGGDPRGRRAQERAGGVLPKQHDPVGGRPGGHGEMLQRGCPRGAAAEHRHGVGGGLHGPPREEGDFTIRMGTDDYESIGVLMMMVPGRLDALNHIKELKEAKDTWRESGDLMYESIDALLATAESMRGDVSQVRDGVDYLERAREIVSQNRPAMESSASAALDELDHLTVWTAALVPYLQTAPPGGDGHQPEYGSDVQHHVRAGGGFR